MKTSIRKKLIQLNKKEVEQIKKNLNKNALKFLYGELLDQGYGWYEVASYGELKTTDYEYNRVVQVINSALNSDLQKSIQNSKVEIEEFSKLRKQISLNKRKLPVKTVKVNGHIRSVVIDRKLSAAKNKDAEITAAIAKLVQAKLSQQSNLEKLVKHFSK